MNDSVDTSVPGSDEPVGSTTQIRAIADYVADGIVTIDQRGVILTFNLAAERMFGFLASEILGCNIRKLMPATYANEHDSYVERYLRTGHKHVINTNREAIGLRKDGSTFDIELGVSEFWEDGRRCFAGVVRDITARKQAEQALRLAQFSVDHAADAIFSIRPDGSFFSVNKAACRSLGYSREELIEMSVFDVGPDFPQERWQEQWATCKRQRSRTFESRHRNKQGHCFPVEITVNFLEYEGQDFLYAFARDITTRKQAEQQIESLARFPEENPFPVLKVSMDGTLQYANQASEPLLRSWQCRPGEKLPAKYGLVLHDAVKAGRCAEFEVNCDERTYSLAIAPLRDSGYAYLYGRDVTERNRSQQELAAYAEETAAINEALTQACLEAEAATVAKTNFLANMSHEIRTPMTAIVGYAEQLLIQEGIDNAPSERTEAFETILRNGRQLLQLINDILDISKIESGKLQIERVDCTPWDIVTDVVDTMRGRAKEKGLRLIVGARGKLPRTIQTDPTRLRQILVNLVGNAVKFTSSGQIEIVVQLDTETQPETPLLKFDVVDTGIGIAPEQLEHIIEPFSQADATTTRKYGGTGLGLAIVKRLVGNLGGALTVQSEPGRGSTFTATIATGPLSGVDMVDVSDAAFDTIARAASLGLVISPPTLNGRVLLAEDGLDNQRLIALILRKAGAEVSVADDGQEAFDVALAALDEKNPFDVILMDMQMPVLDGYEATAKLRAAGYDRPIVALTAHAMAGDREKCIEAGCDEYATKPIDRVGLISLVASQMERGKEKKTLV
ncbi:MAG: PAS domain S-box protein [Planctomycetes bacterium]|nr:PAS domain S-box protein [Planctomycetota bacterium]